MSAADTDLRKRVETYLNPRFSIVLDPDVLAFVIDAVCANPEMEAGEIIELANTLQTLRTTDHRAARQAAREAVTAAAIPPHLAARALLFIENPNQPIQ